MLGDSGEHLTEVGLCSRLDAVGKQRSFHDWMSSKSYLGGKTRQVNDVIGKEQQSLILTRLEGCLVIFVAGQCFYFCVQR